MKKKQNIIVVSVSKVLTASELKEKKSCEECFGKKSMGETSEGSAFSQRKIRLVMTNWGKEQV